MNDTINTVETPIDIPTQDILIENIQICPIDDHQTMGILMESLSSNN